MNVLYLVAVSPIETVVDWIFNFVLNKWEAAGVMGAVAAVSLAVNFLALPLYAVADALQKRERAASARLAYRAARIRRAFKGDERFMMLAAYYRQNGYRPIYALRSSLPILIEIPFFVAAYHYLSRSEVLRGAAFWVLGDLGAGDALLSVGGRSVNVLPLLMTLVNVVSGAVYLKGAPLREKLQLYGVAALFLALLYRSPSGLVAYWILNNVFSLAKNIVMRSAHPKRILRAIVGALLVAASLCALLGGGSVPKKALFCAFAAGVSSFGLWRGRLARLRAFAPLGRVPDGDGFFLLFFSGLGLALLCGLVLPASVIATDPAEFSFLGETDSPVSYVVSSFFVFLGFFVLWPCAVFWLFGRRVRAALPGCACVLFLCAVLNVFVFPCGYGDLNIFFELEDSSCLRLPLPTKLLSALAFLLVCAAFLILLRRGRLRAVSAFMVSLCVAEGALAAAKVFGVPGFPAAGIRAQFAERARFRDGGDGDGFSPVFQLSRTERNVVVIFLDRAISSFAPRIFGGFEDIRAQFGGFVYFPNTLSFSTHTATGGPPLMGGYEYTQRNMNARNGELLREKHNEATLVMPRLFLDGGFRVTVTDPPLPNYYVGNGKAAFEPYPQMRVDFLSGRYYGRYVFEKRIVEDGKPDALCRKEIVKFSVLQVISPFLRNSFYGNLKAKTLNSARRFLNLVSAMYYLPEITELDSGPGAFAFIESDLTHEVFVPLAGDYETPAVGAASGIAEKHFQANVSAYKQLGKWFDFLRGNGVWDNTRVVIVSDHGYDLDLPAFSSFGDPKIPASYNALLLVKDFGAGGALRTDGSFMTTADTLFLAKEGLALADENPFTGRPFVQQKEGGVDVYQCLDWNVSYLRGDTVFALDEGRAFHVGGNIFDEGNWRRLGSGR